jgi:hypothetical protein
MKTKVCRVCKREKSVESFYKRTSYPDGLANECRICINVYAREYRKRKKQEQQEPEDKVRKSPPAIRLSATRPDDYCEMWEFLSSIGYDVNGNVHLQFCNKYGLTPDPIPLKIKKRLTYQDCQNRKDPN